MITKHIYSLLNANVCMYTEHFLICCTISFSRTKLAIVDDNSILMVYNITTKQLIYQEPNATSVAWNSQYEVRTYTGFIVTACRMAE